MSLVELPLELQSLLQIGIQIVVVFVLVELSKLIKTDLSGYSAQVVAAVFSAVMVVINALLGLIPANYEGIASALLNLLVVLLGAFGLYKAYRTFRPK